MEFTFEIPGRPQPKERPRKGKGGHWYTPAATKAAEKLIADEFRAQRGPWFNGPIRIDTVFSPELTVVTIETVEWDSPVVADIDNLHKLVQDALQGVAFDNDRQVVAITAEKS